MQCGGCSDTQGVQTPGGQPGVDQERQVQAQQGQGEVDENLRGVVPTKLPESERRHKGGELKVKSKRCK